jgi:hypothetical protein
MIGISDLSLKFADFLTERREDGTLIGWKTNGRRQK